MSFGNALKNFSTIQEALILGLMMVTVFALFYLDLDLTYKLGVAVLAFSIIFLTTLAAQMLRQIQEPKQA
jgi:hypothetical protein